MESFVLYVHDLQARLFLQHMQDAAVQEWSRPYGSRSRHLHSILVDLETNHIVIRKRTNAPFDMNKRIVDRLAELNIGTKPRQMTLFLNNPPTQKTAIYK
ncbi:hypothetical protein NCCP2222_33720 [Sporosarcina sp. NCCP-2222]|uniref:hypothetical protein n=1 Tax=Sporosarcina sp. NCCP-2222 TaxID=2935073 RepID=UPI00207DBD7E|nr:hypothetical protein [Sporosarcina sp. NCCP-2222]GKV57425.1 hypothetical protein NCCP2222_33720 [Sporosarcina sp. NCCP-2222]